MLPASSKNNIELAQAWQLHFREATTSLLEEDYIIDQFVVEDKRCWYVMRRDRVD